MKKCKINLLVGLTTLAILIGPISVGAGFDFDRLKIKSNLGLSDLSEIKQLLKGKHVQDEIVIKFKGDEKPFRVVKIPKGKIEEKMAEYLKRRDVDFVEPNYIAYALMIPNDPYYQYQWNLDNNEYGGINLEAVWDISTGAGVTVAIIDTGIAYENYGWNYQKAPDLANTCFVSGYDFVNNDSHPNDDEGHGTHVAGTVAQSTNNNLGVAGVAFNACLMPIKVLNNNGSGTYTDIANGIIWATDHGAQVINLSLGGSSAAQVLEEAVAYAYNKGVTVVAAAGNDGSSNISYPAAYDNYVIAVGATQYDENLAPYSNYGSGLDLVAPGGNTNLDQNNDGYVDGVLQQTFIKQSWRTTWGYYFMQGTSMAAPHVAGAAALIIAHGNATTPNEIQTALQETAKDLGTTGFDETYGWGLVDTYAALQWTAVPNNPPTVDNQTIIINEDTSATITLTANDIDNDSLTYIVSEPTNGTLTGIAPNVIYTPEADYNGTDSFTFKVNDGKTNSNIAIVSIIVNLVNDAPLANSQSIETTQDTILEITLTASDIEDDFLTYSIIDSPLHGILSGSAPNITYTPTDGYTGTDSFTFKINDGELDSNLATVSIVVNLVATTMCWQGSNQYLYYNRSQAKKFCKCAQGIYGYDSYNYTRGRQTVYRYLDSADNENWQVSLRSSYRSVSEVTCEDGQVYLTDQDYYR